MMKIVSKLLINDMRLIITQIDIIILGVSPKKGASETFGTDVMFCSAHCGVIIQRISDLKISSYS